MDNNENTDIEQKIPIYYGEPANYSQDALAAKALNYIKSCKPEAYRQMKEDGDLEEYCRLKAKAALREAETLIASGEPDFIAWNRAIRSEILESETD